MEQELGDDDVHVVLATVDERLDENSYIVPGLGMPAIACTASSTDSLRPPPGGTWGDVRTPLDAEHRGASHYLRLGCRCGNRS